MKSKSDILFLTVSALLIIIGIIFVVYAINFLAIKINTALNIGLVGDQKAAGINFEGLKKIGLIKE
ncbi:MAG: hypothetical protein AAB396_01180 [Patescibacteria group bacterium]